jgi:hypothetical protein
MIDVDDVLLLRPVPLTAGAGTSGFGPQPPRPAPGARAAASVIIATVCPLDGPADLAAVEEVLLPALAATDSPPLATFVEEPSANTFPALPVRTGEHVVVWIQRIPADEAQVLAGHELVRDLLPGVVGVALQLRLEPTPRSRLR